MFPFIFLTISMILWSLSVTQEVYESDVNFRIDAGSRTCFFEKGLAGQMMEAKYQVIDGQHGDFDISFEIIDPKGNSIVNDHKQSHNSIIMDLEHDGDYVFCMDNTHSVMNSKLVFVYVLIEDKVEATTDDDTEGVVEDGKEHDEVLEWMGTYDNGEPYYLQVADIANSLTRTLRQIVKARHALNMYGALKTRDNYLAFEDTFIVDVWSSFQISFMCIVGMLQVYMIKKLFNRSNSSLDGLY